jgi:hypothetical protein
MQRIEKMGDASIRAVQIMERGQNGDRAAPLAEVVAIVRSLSDRIAVQQSTMEQGSIELF